MTVEQLINILAPTRSTRWTACSWGVGLDIFPRLEMRPCGTLSGGRRPSLMGFDGMGVEWGRFAWVFGRQSGFEESSNR
jgi:hypothetical protein